MPIQIVWQYFELNQTGDLSGFDQASSDIPLPVGGGGVRVTCDADFQVHVFAYINEPRAHMGQVGVGLTSSADPYPAMSWPIFKIFNVPGGGAESFEMSLGCRAAHPAEAVIVRATIPKVEPPVEPHVPMVSVSLMVITEPGAQVNMVREKGHVTPVPHVPQGPRPPIVPG